MVGIHGEPCTSNMSFLTFTCSSLVHANERRFLSSDCSSWIPLFFSYPPPSQEPVSCIFAVHPLLVSAPSGLSPRKGSSSCQLSPHSTIFFQVSSIIFLLSKSKGALQWYPQMPSSGSHFTQQKSKGPSTASKPWPQLAGHLLPQLVSKSSLTCSPHSGCRDLFSVLSLLLSRSGSNTDFLGCPLWPPCWTGQRAILHPKPASSRVTSNLLTPCPPPACNSLWTRNCVCFITGVSLAVQKAPGNYVMKSCWINGWMESALPLCFSVVILRRGTVVTTPKGCCGHEMRLTQVRHLNFTWCIVNMEKIF